ncbi:MAG TPA: MBL fold metallo-hydrolase [Candidatus Limnocylindrales bacterium]|nr:MBL fold metallo-hydrolase [Candidatus Limnocylindrales bacterium]
MKLEKLATDIYAYLQPDHGLGWSNSGLIARGGGLVVDTLWDLPRTRAMLETYATVHPQPPQRVVNTHHNGDHCWGNQLLEGAEIIGHRECAQGMLHDIQPDVLQAMLEGPLPEGLERFSRALADYDFRGIRITPPNHVFDERLDLDLDGVAVEILYVGPAHTMGDAIVHLPGQRVVFGGDVMWNRCTPIGWEGTYAQWFRALDRIAELEPDVVVPGHGPPTDVAGVMEVRRYFEYVLAESRAFYNQGLSEMDAARRMDLGPYADWTEPERVIFNVRRAYRELRGDYEASVDAITVLREMGTLAEEMEARRS